PREHEGPYRVLRFGCARGRRSVLEAGAASGSDGERHDEGPATAAHPVRRALPETEETSDQHRPSRPKQGHHPATTNAAREACSPRFWRALAVALAGRPCHDRSRSACPTLALLVVAVSSAGRLCHDPSRSACHT